MKIATLDIGSNTVRLLLGAVEQDALQREQVNRAITRLAGGFTDNRLHPEAIARTVDAVKEYARQARAFEAVEIRAVCTGVTRRANNAEYFLTELSEQAGLSVYLIDGNLEAGISALGGANEIGLTNQSFWLVDIGGFSTEIALVENAELERTVSLELGAVTLTETYLLSDPPTSTELAECRAHIERVLRQSPDIPAAETVDTLVGTAGTITTLAAMDLKMERYEPYRLNRRMLDQEKIAELLSKMIAVPAVERLTMPGLEKGREDLIPAGALIAMAVLKHFGQDRMMVTEGGVLEGLALWSNWPPEQLSVDQSPP